MALGSHPPFTADVGPHYHAIPRGDCGDYSGNGTGFARRISGLSCQVKKKLYRTSFSRYSELLARRYGCHSIWDLWWTVTLAQTQIDGAIVPLTAEAWINP